MLVVLDTTMLTLFLKPDVVPPNDPATGQPVRRAAERVQHLMERLTEEKATILIPSTVWAEFLVVADDTAQEYLAAVKDRANFRIASFDQISAVEAALDQRRARHAGNRHADLSGSRQCLKADRQIVAIAKTNNADVVYTADHDIVKIGGTMGVPVKALWDLEAPESKTPLLDETV